MNQTIELAGGDYKQDKSFELWEHGRKKSNHGHFNKIYGTSFRIAEPESEASTTIDLHFKSKIRSKSAIPSKESQLTNLISDELKG